MGLWVRSRVPRLAACVHRSTPKRQTPPAAPPRVFIRVALALLSPRSRRVLHVGSPLAFHTTRAHIHAHTPYRGLARRVGRVVGGERRRGNLGHTTKTQIGGACVFCPPMPMPPPPGPHAGSLMHAHIVQGSRQGADERMGRSLVLGAGLLLISVSLIDAFAPPSLLHDSSVKVRVPPPPGAVMSFVCIRTLLTRGFLPSQDGWYGRRRTFSSSLEGLASFRPLGRKAGWRGMLPGGTWTLGGGGREGGLDATHDATIDTHRIAPVHCP